MIGYYVASDECDLLYVPHNFSVVCDGESYDVRNLPEDVKLVDRTWDNDGICFFERGIHNTMSGLILLASVFIPDSFVASHRWHCEAGENGPNFCGEIGFADVEAISMYEEARESVWSD